MKSNKLYAILDLIEEINKINKMIEVHSTTESKLMLDQYSHQKLKLSSFLFKELLSNTDDSSEVMHIIKLFIEKFYRSELQDINFSDDSFKQIENLVS